jgi:hypothetical protein
LRVDGRAATPTLVESRTDRYYLLPLADTPGEHRAAARVRVLETGAVVTITAA